MNRIWQSRASLDNPRRWRKSAELDGALLIVSIILHTEVHCYAFIARLTLLQRGKLLIQYHIDNKRNKPSALALEEGV